MLEIKILGYHRQARYVVRRIVTSALDILKGDYPGAQVHITDVSAASDICRYSMTFVNPSLVINEKLVCAGRVPSQGEVRDWLLQALAG